MIITDKIRNSKNVNKGWREVFVGASRISWVLSRCGQPMTNEDDTLERIDWV